MEVTTERKKIFNLPRNKEESDEKGDMMYQRKWRDKNTQGGEENIQGEFREIEKKKEKEQED